jgi:lambda repressor-like predicted transcriptional regulator
MADEVPPEAPKQQRRKNGITREIYEKMAQLYLIEGKRSIRTLAAAAGVSNETASKAITTGWPERSWPSFRERSELFDRQKGAAKRAQPLTVEEVQTLKTFLEIKVENANALRALSGSAQSIVATLRAAMERATCDRQGTRRRVVVDVTGTGKNRREVHKTVTEDVLLPPYLPNVVSALEAAARVVAISDAGVHRWMTVQPGDLDRGVSKSPLTPEQMQYIIDHDGKLPEGVTREQLGW